MKTGLLRSSCGVAIATLLAMTFANVSHAVDRVDNAEAIVTSPAAAAAAGALEGCLQDGTGTGIDISYYVPAHNPGEKMPMILHSHGWGGSKHNDPSAEIKENELFGSERGFLNRMVDKGYIVVSFSERGWGNSGGEVRGIDRSCETKDASAILDWAEDNLPVAMVEGNPVVGSFGGSYGGGFQHMLIQEDARIDGVVILGSWNSLPYALVPNGILKRSFASLLCGLGQSASLDPVFAEGCAQAFLPVTRTQSQVTGTPGSTNFVNMLERNGIDYFDGPGNYFREYGYAGDIDAGVGQGSYRDASVRIEPASAVPAMYIQGNRDVLFNMNEAIRNYRYMSLQTGSPEVWFLTNQSGHMNPLANQVNSSTNCGDIDIWEASEAFFYDKLMRGLTNQAGSTTKAKGKPRCKGCKVESGFSGERSKKPACRGCKVESRGPISQAAAPALDLANIPKICVSLNEFEGVNLNAVPHPELESTYFQSKFIDTVGDGTGDAIQVAGIVENAPTALTSLLTPDAFVPGTDSYLLQYSNKTLPTQEAKFVPLHEATEGEIIAGVPVFSELQIQSISQTLIPAEALQPIADLVSTLGGIIPVGGIDTIPLIDAFAYIGVGVERTGEDDNVRRILLDGQAQPFGSADFNAGIPQEAIDSTAFPELSGVGFKLQAGDQVGLMLFSEHPQYEFASTQLGTNAYTIKGKLELPIFTPGSDEPIKTYPGEITPKPCNTTDPVEFVYTLSTCLDDPAAAIIP